MTKEMATELMPFQINVNALGTGLTDTRMSRRSYWEQKKNSISWHRVGEPKDQAAAITYLVSEAAEYLTGQVICPNGGGGVRGGKMMKDYLKIAGKAAIVSGSAQGIGKGIAKGLASYGAKVIICDINDELGLQTVEEIREDGGCAEFCSFDALSSESIKRLVDKTKQKFGSVDIVVNSVGGGEQPRGFETLSDDDWDRIIRLNLYSMFYMCRAAFPYMKEQLSGKIVNISSGFALAGGDYCAHYATAKAGAIGFTTSLAKEMAPYNVNVNVIPVPTTDTPLLRATLSQEMIQREIDVTPMKRIATTEDIADTVLFLVSDAARYITGQIIAPNGGRRMLV